MHKQSNTRKDEIATQLKILEDAEDLRRGSGRTTRMVKAVAAAALNENDCIVLASNAQDKVRLQTLIFAKMANMVGVHGGSRAESARRRVHVVHQLTPGLGTRDTLLFEDHASIYKRLARALTREEGGKGEEEGRPMNDNVPLECKHENAYRVGEYPSGSYNKDLYWCPNCGAYKGEHPGAPGDWHTPDLAELKEALRALTELHP